VIQLLDFAAIAPSQNGEKVWASQLKMLIIFHGHQEPSQTQRVPQLTAEETGETGGDPYSYWYDASADRCTLVNIPKWQNFDGEDDGTDPPIGDTHGMHYFQRSSHDLSKNTHGKSI